MSLREISMFSSFAFSFVSRRIPCCGTGDGREEKQLDYVRDNAVRGDPASVIRAMDAFAESGTWFMSIGDRKGKILDAALARRDPVLVLELGSYCGYSAVRIAAQLQRADSKLFSIEINPRYAGIARETIELAGLSSRIQILLGALSGQIETLREALKISGRNYFDFIFIDHNKNCYLEDYLLLKSHRLVGDGTVIFTDNLGFPGSPDFWRYLHSEKCKELSTEYHESKVEYLNWINDTVAVSTFRETED